MEEPQLYFLMVLLLSIVLLGFTLYVSINDGFSLAANFTIQAAFFFWYILPAINLLFLNLTNEENIINDHAVGETIFILFIYHLIATISTFLACQYSNIRSLNSVSCGNLKSKLLPKLVIFSSLIYLMSKYAENGIGLVYSLLLGESSAREQMQFYNISDGATSSLMGLWEIVNIAFALFLLSYAILTREKNMKHISLSCLFIMFIGTGTRSIILLAIFCVILAMLLRKEVTFVRHKGKESRIRKYLSYIIVGIFSISALQSFFSRFSKYEFGFLVAIFSTFLSHNDMFRELMFVVQNMPYWEPKSTVDFTMTPFTFLLPRFLGFSKDIPDHLLAFNLHRGGIDLTIDQGNFFPGIIADFFLNYHMFGFLIFALFIYSYFFSLRIIFLYMRLKFPKEICDAYIISTFAYLFISFRNIQGSLVMVVIINIILAYYFMRSSVNNCDIDNKKNKRS